MMPLEAETVNKLDPVKTLVRLGLKSRLGRAFEDFPNPGQIICLSVRLPLLTPGFSYRPTTLASLLLSLSPSYRALSFFVFFVINRRS
jgi:hypothetical protein